MAINDKLRDAFRYHLQRLNPLAYPGSHALHAIEMARDDIARDVTRYPRGATVANPCFADYGEKHLRWVECPESMLRFVGLASDIVRLRHTGWYTEDDGLNGETARGVVYQLPARGGKPRYVYGVADPNNAKKSGQGPALLSFDPCDDKDDAARWADGMAESYAERERDYQRAWQAGAEYRDLGESISEFRKLCLELIAEYKRGAVRDGFDSARDAVLSTIARYRRDICEAKEKRQRLLNAFGREPAFSDC